MFKTTDPAKFDKLMEIGSSAFVNPTLSMSGPLKPNIDKLILSEFWPREVPATMIVQDSSQIVKRAKSIIRSYGLLKGKKFLDVGCGMGHCVFEATQMGAEAYGFDIVESWATGPTGTGSILTTDFDEIKSHGPYDVISLYDVIDHVLERVDCIQMLRRVRSVCSANTIVRVRCHPFTSRHGGHLYQTRNRAYGHILLSDEEFQKVSPIPVRKIIRPIAEYKSLFETSGFLIKSTNKIIHPMESVFETGSMIAAFRQRLGKGGQWQAEVLPIEFVDYILQLDTSK